MTLDEMYSKFGAEFDNALQRSDGKSVAKLIHARLENDLHNWFYDRIFRMFDSVSASEWSKQDQFMSEIRCRNEVSCIQSIESALMVQESGYIPASKMEWFVQWILKLNLGPGADEARLNRIPYYQEASNAQHVKLFSAVLANALPKTEHAYFYILLNAPLLFFATKASIAIAFDDHSKAKSIQAEQTKLESQLQVCISKVQTGGGVFYVIENEKGLLTTHSPQYGTLFHIWTNEHLANTMCLQYGNEYNTSTMCYREFIPQLEQLKECGIRFVTLDRELNAEVRIVSVQDVMEVVQKAIDQVDASELGSAYFASGHA